MARELSEREKWFAARIGQRLYRPNTNCCEFCTKVYEEGIIVTDEYHANYLAEMEAAYSHDGIPIQYFDTREEALEFEKNKPPSQSLKDKQ